MNIEAPRNIPELFGSMVFNDSVMKDKLPKDIYNKLKECINEGTSLDRSTADVIASAMKDWSIEKGVTHYTHWFQPMTGITAEKHDSFITPVADDKIIMEFSGKELIKGEPDASSFPSGGLRATFEARGYTAWDPTSYAFIKDSTLCIPTVFCSYGGHILDKKTPLLRSIQAIKKQAKRVVDLFGNPTNCKHIDITVGPEQEYFLIDREQYNERLDLILCGRTLFGAKPPKGQEMGDHYFGVIKPRVLEFMRDLDMELWNLGILAKTEHNEVAPAQHELAPIFDSSNIATDHNQLTMETMKKVAQCHGLACLLHEKPFAGVNGSGKHNNWSLSTDTGINLFDPGDEPQDNKQFLLFLAAVIKAVDEHQDLLRISVTGAGNDHRLGGDEAPPAIVSMYLGDEIDGIIKSYVDGNDYVQKDAEVMTNGVTAIPNFAKDTTDRNRTSPLAFTGNKFEFRMLGSTSSIACPNTIVNTIVADVLCDFANRLEKANDFDKELNDLLTETFKAHRKIIFNGNNYTKEWVEEAKKRGLLNLKTTPDALVYYIKENNIELFEKHKVYSRQELHSRYEILMDNYCNTLHIETLTMLEMINKEIIPAVSNYVGKLSKEVVNKRSVCSDLPCEFETDLIRKISNLCDQLYAKKNELAAAVDKYEKDEDVDIKEKTFYYKDVISNLMNSTRIIVDELETMVSKQCWPFPSYSDLLYKS